MVVSVVSRQAVNYPTGEAGFAPSTAYPEYPFERISPTANAAYEMVRDAFAESGVDAGNFGTAQWNPLGQWVKPGSKVFVLCNFVYHRRPGESLEAFFGKCIHASVLRAVIDYILIAAGPTGRVVFGNAPLQACSWNNVLSATGANEMMSFYEDHHCPVSARDLRLFVAERKQLGQTIRIDRRDESDVVAVDLGHRSLLDCHYQQKGKPHYRVQDYSPQRTEACHSQAHHRYLIHRDVLESDVVFSLPKLKTHQKVGITCGLKGFVGVVGHKDCLAHHRFGDPRHGGDEYPKASPLRIACSRFHDWVYSRPPDQTWSNLFRVVDRAIRRLYAKGGGINGGAWFGNDTAWRMTLDLARIVYYADRQGRVHDAQQRHHLCLIDGILAGEGEGPLRPTPAETGVLIFSDDVPLADRIACRLMGFNPQAISLVDRAFSSSSLPLSSCKVSNAEVIYNGRSTTERELPPALGRPFHAPFGWRNHVEVPMNSDIPPCPRNVKAA